MLLQAQAGLAVASGAVLAVVEVDFVEATEGIAILAVGEESVIKVSVMGLAAKLLPMPHLGLVADGVVVLAVQMEIVEVAAGMNVSPEERQGAI
jgi:hypothetical protein